MCAHVSVRYQEVRAICLRHRVDRPFLRYQDAQTWVFNHNTMGWGPDE